MVKIDLKDRKILYQLDLNCRQSNAQIGKKVGLSKQVVDYRIKRMQEEGVIKYFWTAIDTYKLGYNVFRLYINFQDVTPDVEEEIIQHFMDYKNAWAVISFKGDIDFDVVLWVKDVNDFYREWDKTLDRFGNYFGKTAVSTLNQVFAYKKTYLLPEEMKESDREHYRMTCGGKTFQIDEVDYQLLNELAVNGRVSLVELAGRLSVSSQMVKYRINNLIKREVIRAFRVAVDISKLGLQKFAINVYLKDHSKRKPIFDYLKEKTYLEYVDVAVGWADLQFEVIVENVDKLLQIMEEIESKFPGAVRKQTFWIAKKYHKERWLPEMMKEDFKKVWKK